MSMNILVVDDCQTIRNAVTKMIKMSGVPVDEIFSAANGAQALKALDEKWVDLVLADINMPEMDGMEMIRAMKKNQYTRKIPIVIVSTERSEAKKKELSEMGVKYFVHKPFSPENIIRIVKDITEG